MRLFDMVVGVAETGCLLTIRYCTWAQPGQLEKSIKLLMHSLRKAKYFV
jgi:hypothetical protein